MSSHANVTKYVDPKEVNKTYRPKSYTMSPGLLRAREPYRVKNILTGLTLGAFGVAIWAWSISAVKQDEFDDVDEEARRLAHPSTLTPSPVAKTVPKEEVIILNGQQVVAQRVELKSQPAPETRGLLVKLLGTRFPGVFDPKGRTLVWGAPEVDRIGSMSDH